MPSPLLFFFCFSGSCFSSCVVGCPCCVCVCDLLISFFPFFFLVLPFSPLFVSLCYLFCLLSLLFALSSALTPTRTPTRTLSLSLSLSLSLVLLAESCLCSCASTGHRPTTALSNSPQCTHNTSPPQIPKTTVMLLVRITRAANQAERCLDLHRAAPLSPLQLLHLKLATPELRRSPLSVQPRQVVPLNRITWTPLEQSLKGLCTLRSCLCALLRQRSPRIPVHSFACSLTQPRRPSRG